MKELLFKEESYRIIGACYEVYKEKGCGFLEAVFQECMALELVIRSIPYVEQPTLTLSYKGHPLKQGYQPDFVCYGKIIVELKAVKMLADEHRAQIINYLKATGMQLGLLVNFGHYPKVEIERFLNIPDYKVQSILPPNL
jgi:GxxExxY protein